MMVTSDNICMNYGFIVATSFVKVKVFSEKFSCNIFPICKREGNARSPMRNFDTERVSAGKRSA